MKFFSVLFTIALLATANSLAAHLKRIHALPVRVTTTPSNFHHNESNQ